MKKYLLILILGIFLTACDDVSDSHKSTMVYENTQTKEEEITDEKEDIQENHDSQNDIDIIDAIEEDEIAIVSEKVKAVDLTIKQPSMDIAAEVDAMYREAYLSILKNEIATTNNKGEKSYFKDLYKLGTEFENLPEYYSFYYNDLDGDELPDLGIRSNGYTYILKYAPERNEFDVLFSDATMYYTILGTGQLGYHDGLHAGIIRDRYIVLNNNNNEWEIVIDLERGIESKPFYQISIDEYSRINVSEEEWNEITKPFFEAMENAIPSNSLEEVFGELLE